ncbi:GAP family protein [Streptomyces sp. NBC_00582]|uniref:GAP family protein n=1 Tax=Streptomyces sp. NBC_00582 TaxID=2975783 RepID=UPI002E81F980|nr:GAP family protein [Streptomyces sp. NBC_00582]WUB63814.1 GAP family protein [Streptomyces sp. NBC_00582]
MVLDLVVIGVAIAVFPLSVTAFVLVLSARGGTWKGLAFIVSWLGCFVVVLAAVLLTTGGDPPAPRSPPSTAASAVKLAVGVGLIGYGLHRRRPRQRRDGRASHRHESSGGMTGRLDRISVWSAAGLAPLLQPWGLVAAGAATVVGADLSDTSSSLALIAYCVLATSSLLAMEIYTLLAPDSARLRLRRLHTWFRTHQEQALVAVSLVAGLFLVGRSIHQLTS